MQKKIVSVLVEECSENIDENEMMYNETLNRITLNVYNSNSCTQYLALFVVFLVTSAISSVFIYFYWYSKKYYKCLLLV